MTKKTLLILLASVLLVGTLATSATWAISQKNGWHWAWNENGKFISITDETTDESLASLPTVGSKENLLALLKDNVNPQGPNRQNDGIESEQAPTQDGAPSSKSTNSGVANDQSSSSKNSGSSFSKTNVQTEGVDEADIVKTDGTYIYKISNYNYPKLTVIKAFPADEMSIVSTIEYRSPNEDYPTQSFYPYEMYVDDSRLVVIGNYYYMRPLTKEEQANTEKGLYITNYVNTTKVIVYDISDKTNIQAIREIELEGNYVTSRKIGNALYVVNNKYMDYFGYMKQNNEDVQTNIELTPKYRDSILQGSNEYTSVALEDVRYFPTSITPNYLLIGGIDLSKDSEPVQVTTYLGSGQQVYASEDNLYVAVSENQYGNGGIRPMTKEMVDDPAPAVDPVIIIDPMPTVDTTTAPGPITVPDSTSAPAPDGSASEISSSSAVDASTEVARSAVDSKMAVMPGIVDGTFSSDTMVYKFKLNQGKVQFVSNGKVPGTILNQFSMDESNGTFRIATTTGNAWWGANESSKNNLYILDESMKITGKLENLAPGERIYSVRFMGERAYVVTFKSVDPLFVIDLSDPTAPAVLGELKIPGYSGYLHPYDENHIIGFGVDTQEIENEWDPKGEKIAITQGMKIAVFDVTDVNNPIEKFKETIGGRGTYSELLYNHKALLFSKEQELLAFPVTVYEPVADSTDRWTYGMMNFQGLYVYKFNLESGFELRGKISHLTQQETDNIGKGWGWDGGNFIQRALYIKDVLYTISENLVKANSLNTLKEIAQVVVQVTPLQEKPEELKIEEQKKIDEQSIEQNQESSPADGQTTTDSDSETSGITCKPQPTGIKICEMQ